MSFFIYRKPHGVFLLYKSSINSNCHHGDKTQFSSKLASDSVGMKVIPMNGTEYVKNAGLAWNSEVPVF